MAIAIDHLGSYDNLPGLSEEASEFLWRFTICVGRPRTLESEEIRRHCSEVLMLVERHRNDLPITVPKQWDGEFSPSIIQDWVLTLQTMLEVAGKQPRCTWEAPLRPDEPNYGRPWEDVAAEMLQNLQNHHDKVHRKPWWKFW